MKNYTVSLTDTEVKSLEYAAVDNQDWINNAVKNRARVAKIEIIRANTSYCNTNGIAIALGEDAQVITTIHQTVDLLLLLLDIINLVSIYTLALMVVL